MKKMIITTILIFVIGLILCPVVYAEDDDLCDAVDYKQYRKDAEKITVTYEYMYDEKNEVTGFKYLVYNVPDDMFVNYYKNDKDDDNDDDSDETDSLIEIDSETGIGTVLDSNIDKTYTVDFIVNNSACSKVIKTITIKKPRYNELSELEECKYNILEDYIYCQEWVTVNFPFEKDVLIKKINDQVEVKKNSLANKCINCDEEEDNNKKNILLVVKKVLIGLLVICILADVAVMVRTVNKAKENYL